MVGKESSEAGTVFFGAGVGSAGSPCGDWNFGQNSEEGFFAAATVGWWRAQGLDVRTLRFFFFGFRLRLGFTMVTLVTFNH